MATAKMLQEPLTSVNRSLQIVELTSAERDISNSRIRSVTTKKCADRLLRQRRRKLNLDDLDDRYERLRRRNGTPTKPRPKSNIEAGSGVVVGGGPTGMFCETLRLVPWKA
jgi:hypothetical protein